MYAVEVLTAAVGRPVTAAELRAHLRLNDTSEDPQLEDFIDAAVETFESDARRPVLTTVYRQFVTEWPADLVLGRGGVTAVAGVSRYLADGTTTEAVTGWAADLHTPPALLVFGTLPDLATAASGAAVSPAGYVQFAAGWPNAAAVPRAVRVAIKLLAAHLYERREAWLEGRLTEMPHGWASVVTRFRLGLSGDWGQ